MLPGSPPGTDLAGSVSRQAGWQAFQSRLLTGVHTAVHARPRQLPLMRGTRSESLATLGRFREQLGRHKMPKTHELLLSWTASGLLIVPRCEVGKRESQILHAFALLNFLKEAAKLAYGLSIL